MKDLISLDLYFRDFITKKDRRLDFASEYTDDIKNNAIKLLGLINQLLSDLGIESADVTSGWRPSQINNKTTNAAKRSYHMIGSACDILDDKEQSLAKLIQSRPDLLRKYGLWLESPASTHGVNTNWAHLDNGSRADRQSRVFLP